MSGSSYIDLPVELKSLRKQLINIKKKDKKCFYGVMLGILILQIEFPAPEKDFNKIEVKNNTCINIFGYENGLIFPIYI